MTDFKFKTVGKVNEWNVLTGCFVVGCSLGDIEITTSSPTLINQLIEAMKNRTDISLTIGEAE